MEIKLLAEYKGLVEKGNTLTLKQDFEDKRPVFVSDITDLKGYTLKLSTNKIDGLDTIRDLTKHAKDKKTDFKMEDLKYIIFEVVDVLEEGLCIIKGDLFTLGRYLKVDVYRPLKTYLASTNLDIIEVIAEDTVMKGILYRMYEEAASIDAGLISFKGYIARTDCKQVNINLDKFDETFKNLETRYKEYKAAKEKENTIEVCLRTLNVYELHEKVKQTKVLNKGENLRTSEMVQLFSELNNYKYEDVKEMKVLTEGAYTGGVLTYVVEVILK